VRQFPALAQHSSRRAAQETGRGANVPKPQTQDYLRNLSLAGPKSGSLEKYCADTVMAQPRSAGRRLPPEMLTQHQDSAPHGKSGSTVLRDWPTMRLALGVLNSAWTCGIIHCVRAIMIETALNNCKGRRRDARSLLAGSRNTLTAENQGTGMNIDGAETRMTSNNTAAP